MDNDEEVEEAKREFRARWELSILETLRSSASPEEAAQIIAGEVVLLMDSVGAQARALVEEAARQAQRPARGEGGARVRRIVRRSR